jgi:transposase
VDEKHVVFYSEKYAKKAKADRAPALEKARNLIRNPSAYNRSTASGAAKYVKNLTFDAKTGEILEDATQALLLDEEKLRKEEELDGYYALITSEYEEADERIVEIYRGLWKIEESFKVTKSDLETRPVYLSRQDHIEAHFLTCFVSLVIARLMERRMKGRYPITVMLDSLRKASCSHIQQNYYLFDHYDEVLADLGKEFGIHFGKKCMTLGEIKKILGAVKKG